MSDATDRVIALKWVQDFVQYDTEPKLTQGEIELELDRAKIASVWQVNTAYSIGAVVVPETRNGHSYECVQPGTSQGTARSYFDWPTPTGMVFGDGSSSPQLLWNECGTDRFNPSVPGAEHNVFDIGAATKACWLIKARRCTPFINDGDLSFESIRKNCLEEAARFHPFYRPVRVVRA